jgi:hypothetical protein
MTDTRLSEGGRDGERRPGTGRSYTRRGVTKLAAVGVSTLLAGCGAVEAEVLRFRARPEFVCDCADVLVEWAVSASAAAIELIDPETGAVDRTVDLDVPDPTEDDPTSEGTETVTVCEDTDLRLVARWGDTTDASAVRPIRAIPAGATLEIQLSAPGTCVGDTPRWSSAPILPDDGLRVTLVGNSAGRRLTVAHAGAQATLPPLETTTEPFAGHDPGGEWRMRPVPVPPDVLGACRDGDDAVEGSGDGDVAPVGPITITVACEG